MSKKPILYLALLSQPCRSVLLTCAELGIVIEQRIVDLHKAEQMTPEYLKVRILSQLRFKVLVSIDPFSHFLLSH